MKFSMIFSISDSVVNAIGLLVQRFLHDKTISVLHQSSMPTCP